MATKNEPGCDAGLNRKACSISLTFNELLALKANIILGRLWTKTEEQRRVQEVFERIGQKLIRGGFPREDVERLTKL